MKSDISFLYLLGMYVNETSFTVGTKTPLGELVYSKQNTSRFKEATNSLLLPFAKCNFVSVYIFPCDGSEK